MCRHESLLVYPTPKINNINRNGILNNSFDFIKTLTSPLNKY